MKKKSFINNKKTLYLCLFLTANVSLFAQVKKPLHQVPQVKKTQVVVPKIQEQKAVDRCVLGNCVNGKGKIILSETSYYEGGFVNKQYNGIGTFEDENYLYTGQWKDGFYNGKGKLSVKNQGDQAKTVKYYHVYEGEFINGVKNGYGSLAYFISKDTNNVYKGNFKDDQFFGKGSFHVLPVCTYNSDNWTDSRNFTSGTMISDQDKKVYYGAYKSLAFVENIDAAATQNQTKTRESVPQGMFVTHSVNILGMALGQYSVVFKTDMIAKLANGYKRYFVDVTRYSKKYPVPVGASIFYQVINDKNQVVFQQIKIGAEECYFNLDLEGTYTIQVAYDFHDCYGDCNKVESARIQFTLNSQDFVYTN